MTGPRIDELLSPSEIERIRAKGLTEETFLRQVELCRRGVAPVVLDRPAVIGDGISRIDAGEQPRLVAIHDAAARAGRCLKFVPASGAATRMFREWHGILGRGGFEHGEQLAAFAAKLPRFAFYDDLRGVLPGGGSDLTERAAEDKGRQILDCILNPAGLRYASLPKALLKFHRYADGSRTALEEHLVEAALYARDGQGLCRIHFTVSAEHLNAVRETLDQVKGRYEERFGARFEAGLSVQDESTDTIAVDLDGRPFRDRRGELLFRPGGHGALLFNLNRLDGDLVFIKNIDNVVPDRLKGPTVLYKKILGGYLIRLQDELFGHLRALSAPGEGDGAVARAARFAVERLNCSLPAGFGTGSPEERRRMLLERLDRPLRVCGMVKNEGEPGGGPFWVAGPAGGPSPQIVEQAQVDRQSAGQAAIWASATHFNPVDLVCGIRDFRGRPFDLERFVDERQAFLSVKSHDGHDIKALERPGLWNGAMAFWHTVFVEVPIETFNPVKTVEDLLRPGHQA